MLEQPMRTEAQDTVLRGEVEELEIDLDVAGEFDEDGEIEDGDEQDEEEVKEEHNVKPQIAHINTTGTVKQIQLPAQPQGRFAYETPVSPMSAISMPSMSMPSPPSTMGMPVSMPSPSGSDRSWEAPQTPPTRYHQQHNGYPTPPPQMKSVGAPYDLGLGLFDGGYAAEYAQGYNAGMMGMQMGMNSGGGWAAVNPAHPAYHGHQVAQPMGMYAAGLAPGQYLHQPRAAF
jgi:hypothetical protein